MTTSTGGKNTLPNYNGEANEDAKEWARRARFPLDLYGIEEREAKRAIGVAVKGKAFEWLMEKLTKEPVKATEVLLQGLEVRFLSGLQETQVAQRFLTLEIPDNMENFAELLEDGRNLERTGYLSLRPVLEQIARQAPAETKLWENKSTLSSFEEFATKAESVAALTYQRNNESQIRGASSKPYAADKPRKVCRHLAKLKED